MYKYEKIAHIVVRCLALLLLLNALTDGLLIIVDILFVKAQIYERSQIAFQPRLLYAGVDIVVAAFVYYWSEDFVSYIIKNIEEDEEILFDDEETMNSDEEKSGSGEEIQNSGDENPNSANKQTNSNDVTANSSEKNPLKP
jgi:hypothetical protein